MLAGGVHADRQGGCPVVIFLRLGMTLVSYGLAERSIILGILITLKSSGRMLK